MPGASRKFTQKKPRLGVEANRGKSEGHEPHAERGRSCKARLVADNGLTDILFPEKIVRRIFTEAAFLGARKNTGTNTKKTPAQIQNDLTRKTRQSPALPGSINRRLSGDSGRERDRYLDSTRVADAHLACLDVSQSL